MTPIPFIAAAALLAVGGLEASIIPPVAGAQLDPSIADAAHPEARPFDESRDAMAAVDAALSRAAATGKRVIVVMGANWCHDSRALAGWFATPRFAAMLAPKYEVVYVDAGHPTTGDPRNVAVARRFGIDRLKGTPTVFVVSPAGRRLNAERDARSWRDAASRDPQAIFAHFDKFEG